MVTGDVDVHAVARRGGRGGGDRSRRAGGDHPAARGQRRARLPGGRRGERHLHLLDGPRRPGRRRGRRDAAAAPAGPGREPGAAGRRPGRGRRSGRQPTGVPALVVGRAVAPTAFSSGVPFETVRDYLLSLPGLPDDVAAQLRTFTADGSTLPLPVPADRVTTSSAQVNGAPATVLATRDRTLAAVVWVRRRRGDRRGRLAGRRRGPVDRPGAAVSVADGPPPSRATPPIAAAQLVAGLPPAPAVWCSGLRKRYGRQQAVEDVSLEVGRGEVVGLLGPNGAGKTSVIKMLLGLVQPGCGRGDAPRAAGGRPGRPRPRRLPAGALPVPAVAERGRGAGPPRPPVGGRRARAGAARLPGAGGPGRTRRRPRRRLLEGHAAAPRAGRRPGGPARSSWSWTSRPARWIRSAAPTCATSCWS